MFELLLESVVVIIVVTFLFSYTYAQGKNETALDIVSRMEKLCKFRKYSEFNCSVDVDVDTGRLSIKRQKFTLDYNTFTLYFKDLDPENIPVTNGLDGYAFSLNCKSDVLCIKRDDDKIGEQVTVFLDDSRPREEVDKLREDIRRLIKLYSATQSPGTSKKTRPPSGNAKKRKPLTP